MDSVSELEFWKGISILLNNYHAVNKKMFASVITKVQKIVQGIPFIVTDTHLDLKTAHYIRTKEYILESSSEDELQYELLHTSRKNRNARGYFVHYKFLTKNTQENIEALGTVDFINGTYTCKIMSEAFDTFMVKHWCNQIIIEILTQCCAEGVADNWAETVLKPKLLKWCRSANTELKDSNFPTIKSLQLIDLEAYNDLYKQLKQKHAKNALKFWNDAKEKTDPLKFIYEDLAIAAYLITLWKKVKSNGSNKPKAFADLGCGNGLLVYILNEEGFKGYGYDLRARKLWSHYPQHIQLMEEAINPMEFMNKLPEDVDWLIGNHSDELSPWLPAMAGMASMNMCYFLLPCCAFEFSGAKFQRRNSNMSVYQDFYEYAYEISQRSGFDTMQDRLKIPSTKRLALIGVKRKYYTLEAYENRREQIKDFVETECKRYSSCSGKEKNEEMVKIREKTEAVRNCTQIDKKILKDLVLKIFQILLNCKQNRTTDHDRWQRGGRMNMGDIAKNLSQDDLKEIKSECGGIKTLLRNHHTIFEFCGNNLVGIKKPQIYRYEPSKKHFYKKRFCFFHQHHPNGCPLAIDECAFLH